LPKSLQANRRREKKVKDAKATIAQAPSSRDSSSVLPPVATVLIVTTRSLAKRGR